MSRLISDFIKTEWYQRWKYKDCIFTSKGVWPSGILDCFVPDSSSKPSERDQACFPDPEGLTYKHLSPGKQILKSLESMMVGIKGDRIYSLSLMVHPASEKSILDGMTIEERIEEFYKPPFDFMSGENVSTMGLEYLYDKARDEFRFQNIGNALLLKNCVIVIQQWDHHRDCNLHITELIRK